MWLSRLAADVNDNEESSTRPQPCWSRNNGVRDTVSASFPGV
jgi:hypothetical protein